MNKSALEFGFTSAARELNKEFGQKIDFEVSDKIFKTLKVIKADDLDKSIGLRETELLYTKNTTEKQARDLIKYLDENVFIDGEGKTVWLDKRNDIFLFRMVINLNLEDDKAYIDNFKLFGTFLSAKVFVKLLVQTEICDDKLQTIQVVK